MHNVRTQKDVDGIFAPDGALKAFQKARDEKINLYVGKQAIKFNIPEAEAVERLVDLIKEHNKWVEPE